LPRNADLFLFGPGLCSPSRMVVSNTINLSLAMMFSVCCLLCVLVCLAQGKIKDSWLFTPDRGTANVGVSYCALARSSRPASSSVLGKGSSFVTARAWLREFMLVKYKDFFAVVQVTAWWRRIGDR
jgi:hypothetical protein